MGSKGFFPEKSNSLVQGHGWQLHSREMTLPSFLLPAFSLLRLGAVLPMGPSTHLSSFPEGHWDPGCCQEGLLEAAAAQTEGTAGGRPWRPRFTPQPCWSLSPDSTTRPAFKDGGLLPALCPGPGGRLALEHLSCPGSKCSTSLRQHVHSSRPLTSFPPLPTPPPCHKPHRPRGSCKEAFIHCASVSRMPGPVLSSLESRNVPPQSPPPPGPRLHGESEHVPWQQVERVVVGQTSCPSGCLAGCHTHATCTCGAPCRGEAG